MRQNLVNNKEILIVLLTLFITTQYGCGTYLNVGNPINPPSQGHQYLYDRRRIIVGDLYPHSVRDKVIYGGVLNDVTVLIKPVHIVLWIPTFLDLPLTLAGDTITLPFTIYWTVTSVDTELVHAVVDGDYEKLKELIAEGADVREHDSLLIEAIRSSHVNIVNILITHGLDVNARAIDDGSTALMEAADREEIEIVKTLLKYGANVNATNNHGETALMEAAEGRTSEIVKMLLKKGAEVNAKTEKGQTALWRAAWWGRTEIVKILLSHGANVNVETERGKTPLMEAKRKDHLEIVQILRDHGAD